MSNNTFVWSAEHTSKFLRLRLGHDALFQKKNHSWKEFHNILVKNGFPRQVPVAVIRNKWQQMMNSYKSAKEKNNKKWQYFSLFDEYFGQKSAHDKFDSWNANWRSKLITACQAGSSDKIKIGISAFWRSVERDLRSSDLPLECCIQDIQGLWQRLQLTFQRKYRLNKKRLRVSSDWPLYEEMLTYYETSEPESLQRMQAENKKMKSKTDRTGNTSSAQSSGKLFQWSKDITESFIQLRLQHEHLFKEKIRAWKDMYKIMVELGYPSTLTPRIIQNKWTHIMADYQKAMATNNTNWLYYNLFQTYMGESSLNLDPLQNWQEYWITQLILSRKKHANLFSGTDSYYGWRKVEMDLRLADLPLEHSLLNVEDMWSYLIKTFKWKQKFAAKGMLSEVWPYYDNMKDYYEIQSTADTNGNIALPIEYDHDEEFLDDDSDFVDDVKPLEGEDKEEAEGNCCRACGQTTGCVALFEHSADDTLGYKLNVICGVEVQINDGLSKHICSECSRQLAQAYEFRIKCQSTDKRLRLKPRTAEEENGHDDFNFCNDEDSNTKSIILTSKAEFTPPKLQTQQLEKINSGTTNLKTRKKYVYNKICEVCGKKTQKMSQHMKFHSEQKDYKCKYCDKRFKYKSSVSLHEAVHSGAPGIVCRVCGKEFYHMSYYRRHCAYHSAERNFYCDLCGKSFKTKSLLVQHGRTHMEGIHSCNVCSKSFKRHDCLKRHVKQNHKAVNVLVI